MTLTTVETAGLTAGTVCEQASVKLVRIYRLEIGVSLRDVDGRAEIRSRG